MFRANEASRVSAVLAAKLAGDTRAMVDASVELWLSEPEQPGERDAAVAEAWIAIDEGEAVGGAVEAGLMLLRERQSFRPSAFVHLVEHIANPERLLAIATDILDAGWPAHPHLAAIFVRLVELEAGPALLRYIRRHRKRLASDTSSWLAVAFVLTTTWVGDAGDVDKWFRRWEDLDDVPMWILATYAATINELPHNHLRQLVTISRTAAAHAIPDITAGYFELYLMIHELRTGRYDEFVERLARFRELYDRYVASTPLEHPLVRYANGIKQRDPITLADAKVCRPHSIKWRIVYLLAAIERLFAKTSRTLPVFAHVLSRPPAPEIRAARIAMADGRLAEIPWLEPPWERLFFG
jgi:hypothetical protein